MTDPTPNNLRWHWGNFLGRRFYTRFGPHNVGDEHDNLLGRSNSLYLSPRDKFLLSILCICLVLGITISSYLLTIEHREATPKGFKYIMRREWTSWPSCGNASLLPLPAQGLFLVPTNTSECQNETECIKVLKNLQEDYVEKLNRSNTDIPLNFIVTADGSVYESRGWNCSSPFEDNGVKYLAVAFLGTYDDRPPTRKQVNALETFLEFSIAHNRLSSCYRIVTQNFTTTYITDVAFELELKRDKNIC